MSDAKVCVIDGCTRVRGWRDWCKTHGLRWSKYGDPLGHGRVNGVDYNVKADCQVDDCDRKAHAHRYCHKHLTRWKKHGDPNVVSEIRGRPLKGDVPTFAAIHKRIWRIRGSAKNYPCVDCSGVAAEWSYQGGCPNEMIGKVRNSLVPYSENLDLYVPRCVRCHRLFDLAGVNRVRDESGRFRPNPTAGDR